MTADIKARAAMTKVSVGTLGMGHGEGSTTIIVVEAVHGWGGCPLTVEEVRQAIDEFANKG